MKKLTLLIILAFIIQATVSSQSCLPEGITFTTQVQIDSFQSTYPGCTEIGGDVIIGDEWPGTSEITSLNGLIVLTSIGGGLKISDNELLDNLTDLDNLTSIGMHYVMGDPIFSLLISNNENLISLTGLNKVTSIEGPLEIRSNDSLPSLSGLDNIDPGSIAFLLAISVNYSLSTCEVQSVCDYLSDQGAADIQFNASGCNSQEEIEDACDVVGVSDQSFEPIILIYPNPAKKDIFISTKRWFKNNRGKHL